MNCTPSSQSMLIYHLVRNFLRYPYSTVTLGNDKVFLEKQKLDAEI